MKITEVMVILKREIESISNKTNDEVIMANEIDIILFHIWDTKSTETTISDSLIGKLKVFTDGKDNLRMYGAKYVVHLLAIELGYDLSGFSADYQTNKYIC